MSTKRPFAGCFASSVASALFIASGTLASAEAARTEYIPGTAVPVERLLFLPHWSRNVAVGEVRPAACISSDLMRWYRGAGLIRISGQLPFKAPITGDRCRFALTTRPLPATSAPSFKSEDCRAAVDLQGSRVAGLFMQVLEPSEAGVGRCVYRFGLFLEGYNGVLTMSRADLFAPVSRTIYRFEHGMLGQDVPMLIKQFAIRCASAPPITTKAELARVCKS
jgi:hypothetical protein